MMSRRISGIALGILAIVLMASCSLGVDSGTGFATVGIIKNVGVKTLDPGVNMVALSYTLTFTKSGSTTVTETISAAATEVSTTVELGAGTWAVLVEAFNNDTPAVKIGSGNGSVTVVAGQTAPCAVTVSILAGDGTLSLSATWPTLNLAGLTLTGTLTPVSGTNIPVTFTVNGGSTDGTYLNAAVPAGFYTLQLALKNGESVVARVVEAVEIIADKTTPGALTFTRDPNYTSGNAVVTVANNLPVLSAITFDKADGVEIDRGIDTTITATGTPAITGGYTWYLDGNPNLSTYGASATGATFSSGTSLVSGSHTLTVVGRNGTTLSSATMGFTVITVAMALVPGGSFQMGLAGVDEPVHTVNLTAFRMSKYEVTQEEYQSITGYNPSYFPTVVNGPVEMVSWYNAVEFCNKLSERDGLSQVYTITGRFPATGYAITSATVSIDMTKNGYRLPTEAEWEYAAKGGNGSPGGYEYSGSNDIGTVAWWGYWDGGNSGETTNPVGTKMMNGLGLYDMTGNVLEWCQDWYGDYESGTQTDPVGASSGGYRVIRGGSWFNDAGYCRSALRSRSSPVYRGNGAGFRLARRP